MKIDMTDVVVPTNNNNSPRVSPVIEPGIQELTITKASDKIATTGTAYVEIELTSKDPNKQYPLIERFFTSPKSKHRLLALYQGVLGQEFTGDIDTDELNPKLVGKSATFMVDGEEFPKVVGDKVFTNVRARLAFSNFINPEPNATPYIKPMPKTDTTASPVGDLPQVPNVDSGVNDLPF